MEDKVDRLEACTALLPPEAALDAQQQAAAEPVAQRQAEEVVAEEPVARLEAVVVAAPDVQQEVAAAQDA